MHQTDIQAASRLLSPKLRQQHFPAKSAGTIGREVKFAREAVTSIGVDGSFEGYASLFGLPDLGNDIVVSGAFRDSIAKRGALGVKMLWSHDPAQPIGVWDFMKEDQRGLYVRGRLDLAVAKARETYALMKSGAVDGLSIGFKTVRSRRDPRSGNRRLEKVDLWEVSVVTFPMLPQARVSTVKRARIPGPPACRLTALPDEAGRALARAINRAARAFD